MSIAPRGGFSRGRPYRQAGTSVLAALVFVAILSSIAYAVHEISPSDSAAQTAAVAGRLAVGDTDMGEDTTSTASGQADASREKLASYIDVANSDRRCVGILQILQDKNATSTVIDVSQQTANVCVPGCVYSIYQEFSQTRIVAKDQTSCKTQTGTALSQCLLVARPSQCQVFTCNKTDEGDVCILANGGNAPNATLQTAAQVSQSSVKIQADPGIQRVLLAAERRTDDEVSVYLSQEVSAMPPYLQDAFQSAKEQTIKDSLALLGSDSINPNEALVRQRQIETLRAVSVNPNIGSDPARYTVNPPQTVGPGDTGDFPTEITSQGPYPSGGPTFSSGLDDQPRFDIEGSARNTPDEWKPCGTPPLPGVSCRTSPSAPRDSSIPSSAFEGQHGTALDFRQPGVWNPPLADEPPPVTSDDFKTPPTSSPATTDTAPIPDSTPGSSDPCPTKYCPPDDVSTQPAPGSAGNPWQDCSLAGFGVAVTCASRAAGTTPSPSSLTDTLACPEGVCTVSSADAVELGKQGFTCSADLGDVMICSKPQTTTRLNCPNGLCTTRDASVIKELTARGYECVGDLDGLATCQGKPGTIRDGTVPDRIEQTPGNDATDSGQVSLCASDGLGQSEVLWATNRGYKCSPSTTQPGTSICVKSNNGSRDACAPIAPTIAPPPPPTSVTVKTPPQESVMIQRPATQAQPAWATCGFASWQSACTSDADALPAPSAQSPDPAVENPCPLNVTCPPDGQVPTTPRSTTAGSLGDTIADGSEQTNEEKMKAWLASIEAQISPTDAGSPSEISSPQATPDALCRATGGRACKSPGMPFTPPSIRSPAGVDDPSDTGWKDITPDEWKAPLADANPTPPPADKIVREGNGCYIIADDKERIPVTCPREDAKPVPTPATDIKIGPGGCYRDSGVDKEPIYIPCPPGMSAVPSPTPSPMRDGVKCSDPAANGATCILPTEYKSIDAFCAGTGKNAPVCYRGDAAPTPTAGGSRPFTGAEPAPSTVPIERCSGRICSVTISPDDKTMIQDYRKRGYTCEPETSPATAGQMICYRPNSATVPPPGGGGKPPPPPAQQPPPAPAPQRDPAASATPKAPTNTNTGTNPWVQGLQGILQGFAAGCGAQQQYGMPQQGQGAQPQFTLVNGQLVQVPTQQYGQYAQPFGAGAGCFANLLRQQPPAGNGTAQPVGTCPVTSTLCRNGVLYGRNSQCVDTVIRTCEFGCNGNTCASAPTNQCPPAPPQPTAGCNGTYEEIHTTLPSGTNCTTGWRCSGAKPTIVIVANPPRVPAGERARIGWVTTGMKSCTILSTVETTATQTAKDAAASFTTQNAGNTATSGLAQTQAISGATTFTLNCVQLDTLQKSASTIITVSASSTTATTTPTN